MEPAPGDCRGGHKTAGFGHDKPTGPPEFPENPGAAMVRNVCLFTIALVAATVLNHPSQAGPLEKTTLDAMVTRFAAAESVPEELVRRVIKRESRGNPRVVSQGNYGLMQIKLPTARSMGYSGNAAGFLDAETNMTYAVKYLAGAWHVAHGSIDRAVHS